jgi:hypothetical protein
MPGLRKTEIVRRMQLDLAESSVSVVDCSFKGPQGDLPVEMVLKYRGSITRSFQVFVWTIGHGGRTRSSSEYRIQTKLKQRRALTYGSGTPLLLGYYDESADTVGKSLGNSPPDGMKVYAAWSALSHLHVGDSSSCQVNFDLLRIAYLSGVAASERTIADGDRELVFAFRPEFLGRYMYAATGGHGHVSEATILK